MYPNSMTTHPFKHSPLTCDHVEEIAEIGFLAKNGIFLTHCRIFPFIISCEAENISAGRFSVELVGMHTRRYSA